MLRITRVWRAVIACLVAVTFAFTVVQTTSASPATDSFNWLNTSVLVPTPSPPVFNVGDVDEPWAVWGTSTDGGSTIRLHATNLETSGTIDVPDSISQRNPQLDENQLVYDAYEGGSAYTCMLYDLDTGASVEITSTNMNVAPSISAGYVSYVGPSTVSAGAHVEGSSADVFLYDIESGETYQLTELGNVTYARIWGPYVAYTTSEIAGMSLHLYDLRLDPDTADTIVVGPVSGIGDVNMSNGRIVYSTQSVSDYYDLYMYDIDADAVTEVAATHLNESSGWVCGDQIVYVAGGIDPVVTAGGFIYDIGTGRTTGVGTEPGAIDGVGSRNFLFHSSATGSLSLCTLNRPFMDVWGSFSGAYGANALLDGLIMDRDVGLANRTLRLQRSYDLWNWEDIGTASTEQWGYFEKSVGPLTRLTYFRAVFDGEFISLPAHLSGTSYFTSFIPKAKVYTPVCGSRLKVNRYYTVSGGISPSQYDQGASGRLQAYRKVNGHWRGPYNFTLSFPSGKYTAKPKFGARGSWRIRANFYGSDINRAATSGWKYLTVY